MVFLEKLIFSGTVLEAAKEIGYLTGLIATSRITHATPACFASHVPLRDMEDEIALQEIGNYTLGRRVDLMFGGGQCHFKPMTDPLSCRSDNTDVFGLAQTLGWNIGTTKKQFDLLSKDTKLPVMNLFSDDHMAFEIDRDSQKEPSLAEMTTKALEILSFASKDSPAGFFLMVEGSRIDMAGHSNDPAAHVHDILAYHDVISVVKKFVDDNPSTVMISVSDHETGGLALGHQLGDTYPEYKWEPSVIVPVKHSGEYMAQAILAQSPASRASFIKETVFKNWLNITDYTPNDLAILGNSSSVKIDYHLGQMVSNRAGLGWSTHGHSAVDVNLYAYGFGSQRLSGNHENTDIGHFIARQLGLDLNAITKKLELGYVEPKVVSKRETNIGPKHYHNNKEI
jgi:alkaline phosphatase